MATVRTQADLLALMRRLLPDHFLQPLEDGEGPGYELLQAAAQMFARLSTAIGECENAIYILDARRGVLALASVRFTRTVGPTAVTLKAGARVRSSRGGYEFALLTDVPFAAVDLGPHDATVAATYGSEEHNLVTGPVTAADGTTLPGDIDVFSFLRCEDPAVPGVPLAVDPAVFTITQLASATGGSSAALDQLARDRGLMPDANEPSLVLRARIRRLPDTVSPAAIRRACTEIFASVPTSYQHIEAWAPTFGVVADLGGPGTLPALANAFVWDDPRAVSPWRNRWQDEVEHRGAFVVLPAATAHLYDLGLAYDDTALLETDHVDPLTGGVRGFAAFDAGGLTPTAYGGAFDGPDVGQQALHGLVFGMLQEIKPAGSGAILEREGQ